MSKEKQNKAYWVKHVVAPSIFEALVKMDDWGRHIYDMYLVNWEPSEELPGYIKVTLYGWENEQTRETFYV